MSLNIPVAEMDKIRRHGETDYPHECCGVLLGNEVDGVKTVTEALAIKNAREDSPRNRFLFTDADWLASDKYARERGLGILGCYHSHPDHPARPSDYDRDHAWPSFSYLILSVGKGRPEEATSWILKEDRSMMEEEEVTICQPK